MGQIGETRFGGNIGNLAMTPLRVAQQRRGFVQPPFQHVMGEALAGLFKQKMQLRQVGPYHFSAVNMSFVARFYRSRRRINSTAVGGETDIARILSISRD